MDPGHPLAYGVQKGPATSPMASAGQRGPTASWSIGSRSSQCSSPRGHKRHASIRHPLQGFGAKLGENRLSVAASCSSLKLTHLQFGRGSASFDWSIAESRSKAKWCGNQRSNADIQSPPGPELISITVLQWPRRKSMEIIPFCSVSIPSAALHFCARQLRPSCCWMLGHLSRIVRID